MSWFWAAVEWRMGWWAAEIAINIGVAVALLALAILVVMPRLLMQRRCKHERYRETMACNARCLDCGKDLGFIETQRQRNPGGEK